jgi:3-methyladenine DNA glycosylase AlkD
MASGMSPTLSTVAGAVEEVLGRLRTMARPGGREGMARFGINPGRALGVRIPDLRRLARDLGRDHRLALALWATGVPEARILASMVDDVDRVTERQMDRWARDFDSWDLCDQVCGNLFDRTPFAVGKAHAWAASEPEFVKRAGFALMAWRAVHERGASDREFLDYLPVIERQAGDDRNYVKKAVSWALRQIGKRSRRLHRAVISSAKRIAAQDSRPARWVAADTLRELRSRAVLDRLAS